MFGMGFMEIFLVLIIAIIALGPEKLPTAAVEVAKFFKKLKGGIEEAKSTIDNELNVKELKDQAASFKASIDEASSIVDTDFTDIVDMDDSKNDKVNAKPKEPKKKEKISLSEEA